MDSFKDKRVTVMGLGLHGGGEGAVRFFAAEGARVVVTDLKSATALAPTLEKLKGLPITYALGGHRKEDFENADLILQNPGVPEGSTYLALARKHGIPIDTDIGIFFERCPGFIVAVTGTKGKSTVATLLHRIFLESRLPTVLAGNIRVSVLSILPVIAPETVVVLELSSWQLEGLAKHKKSPPVAVITNVLRDHLNRYRDFDSYQEAKSLVFAYQNENDILVLNADDASTPFFQKQARAKIFLWTPIEMAHYLPASYAVAHVRHGTLFLAQEPLLKRRELAAHTRIFEGNALAAATAAWAAGKHPGWPHHPVALQAISSALRSFQPLPGRLETIAEIGGVAFVNDTCATIPDATIAALDAFPGKNILLIAGGMDKMLDYAAFARVVGTHACSVILLSGDASDKIIAALTTCGLQSAIVKSGLSSMDEAVKIAWERAKAFGNAAVLLSPAAASFNLFANEFDRGERFVNAVARIASRVRMTS